MATAVFTAVGQSIGGAMGNVPGAMIGGAIGRMFGSIIDGRLMGSQVAPDGPRLSNLELKMPQPGAPIPVVEGFARVTGRVIWADEIIEHTNTEITTYGSGKNKKKVEQTTYRYTCSFAVAICDAGMGKTRHLGRVWADDKLLNLREEGIQYCFYDGSEDQAQDSTISEKDKDTPAYRGLCYIVFKNFDITDFQYRIPQFSFEVFGPSGKVEDLIRGVDIIPSSTEWGYCTEVVSDRSETSDKYRNATRDPKISDWSLSMDHLQGVLPNCKTAALVVSWFGSDLRAEYCRIEPKVETHESGDGGYFSELDGKILEETEQQKRIWTSAGLVREQAKLISEDENGKPAYGSSPDDMSIIHAIKDLRARGIKVVLYPFVMMDIPKSNNLPNPETGSPKQPAHPWRGRIRSVNDGTSVNDQISALMGAAQPEHYSIMRNQIPAYSGPGEWSYRRFILHLAALAKAAGGVDAFLIGSEFVGLTTSTSGNGIYPFVDALVYLASDVRSILPDTKISYAADWSEYHSHRDNDEVWFHLDKLWSSPDIDFIGIDNYLPLSDWRYGEDHLDYDPSRGQTSVYNLDYLKKNVEGGEYYDWYYASETDRENQVRTPILDQEHSEHWIYRQKAIREWQQNTHYNRPAGERDSQPTGWVAGSKPIWFTELGCGAIELGSNQPNKFLDPKSSESITPHFSSGARDDFMQRQYLRASLEWWRDNGGNIVNLDNILIWSWDARPWPEFPGMIEKWSDGSNWDTGHWLNGRAGAACYQDMIARWMTVQYSFQADEFDISYAHGQCDGLVISDTHSLRDILQPAEILHGLRHFDDKGIMQFIAPNIHKPPVIVQADLALVSDDRKKDAIRITRKSKGEMLRSMQIGFIDSDTDYEVGNAYKSKGHKNGNVDLQSRLAVVSSEERIESCIDDILRRSSEECEQIELTLPCDTTISLNDRLHLIDENGNIQKYRVQQISTGDTHKVQAISVNEKYGKASTTRRKYRPTIALSSRVIQPIFLDLPLLQDEDAPQIAGYLALHAANWPSGADVYVSDSANAGYRHLMRVPTCASAGQLKGKLESGSSYHWNNGGVEVEYFSGEAITRDVLDVFRGKNSIALLHPSQGWEIAQFQCADLIRQKQFRLSRFLRGQRGTEQLAKDSSLEPGARVVSLNQSVIPVELEAFEVNTPMFWKVVPSGEDPGDPIFATYKHTYLGIPQRPYAPVALKAKRVGNFLEVDWTRSSRIKGNIWPSAGTIPLGETSERYSVRLIQGLNVLSDLNTTEPNALIPVSGLSGEIVIQIAQNSESFGHGCYQKLTVTV